MQVRSLTGASRAPSAVKHATAKKRWHVAAAAVKASGRLKAAAPGLGPLRAKTAWDPHNEQP